MGRVLALALTGAIALAAPAAAQVPFDPSPIQHVEVNGANLGYRTVGSGPPLLMIMGFGGTMAEWDPALVANLATQHTVVVFDNRGIATSVPAPIRRLTVAQMADDAAGLLEALGFAQADVLGWSMGGNIAQELVLRHPEKVRRLVLAATDPGGPQAVQPTEPLAVKLLTDTNPPISLLIKSIFPPTPAGRAAAKAYLGRVVTWPDIGPDGLTTATATVKAQIRAEGPIWTCRGCGAYPRLPTIRTPTLVTDGTLDILEPPQNSRIIARRIPGAKLRFFAGSGHAHLFQFNGRYAGLANGFFAAP